MNWRRWACIACLAVVAGLRIVFAWEKGRQFVRGVPTEVESATLYSIDGTDHGPSEAPSGAEKFHGFPVLGKIDLIDPGVRRDVLRALNEGVKQGGVFAKCFWPRHGLRAVSGGKQVDYVVCFACTQMRVYAEGSNPNGKEVTISKYPRETFNRVLNNAGVPVVPDDE